MQSRFVRAAVVFVFAGAVSFLMPCEKAAAAIVEFCPARMDAAHVFGGSYDGLIAFYVAAESARSVSANVIAQGESGWYTFQFQNAAIVADLAHFRSHTVRFDRTLYHTKRMYVRFPAAERIVRWWIYDATSLGDTAFGWDQRGDYICLPQPDAYPNVKRAPLPDPPIRTNDSGDLLVPPGPSDTILASYKTAAPADIAKCDKAFVPATVVRAISPVYPRSVRGLAVSVTSEIEVAINANGSLAGAWVYTPSGIPDIDAAALRAAEISTYRAGVAMCRPAPGTYLFRADFDPS
jgi:hypothetical protein